jgi:hypothetical protein
MRHWLLRVLGTVELDDLAFCCFVGVSNDDVHQETVELRLWQWVGTFLLDRILGCEHHEQVGHFVGFAGDGDLALLHSFQQRRLYLGGRAASTRLAKIGPFANWNWPPLAVCT